MKNIKQYSQFVNESEKIEGGKSSGMTLMDIAMKHSYDDATDSTSKERIDALYSDLLNQLEIGISVEMEHTKDEDLAREIAMDHLEEDPYYYEKLGKSGLID